LTKEVINYPTLNRFSSFAAAHLDVVKVGCNAISGNPLMSVGFVLISK
jgi:hypothetical protein